jgi:hypothetical protein
MRPRVKPLEPEVESSRLRLQTMIGMAMNRSWNDLLGHADYIIAHGQKVVLFVFPLPGARSLLVSAGPDYPLEEFRQVLGVVNRRLPKGLR